MALLLASIAAVRLLAAGGWPMLAGLVVCFAYPKGASVAQGLILWFCLAWVRRRFRMCRRGPRPADDACGGPGTGD